MIDRILVPLDGSEQSEGVLPEVIDLARRLHASVQLLQVFETDDPVAEMYGLYNLLCPPEDGEQGVEGRLEVKEQEDRRHWAEGYMSRVATSLEAEVLDVSWEVVKGRTADTIAEFAHADRVDMVAMSTHGRSGLDRAVSGSVADEVMRKVGIPMLLVKATERRGADAGQVAV